MNVSIPGWRLLAQRAEPVPPDWRERLAVRLGQRPRRIGAWAELALYGALECLDRAGEDHLPEAALLRVSSGNGGLASWLQAMDQQAEGGLPMPFTFLQAQSSQLLAVLGQHLRWRGDARFVLGPDPAAVLRLALAESGPAGLLFGRVEEAPGGQPPRSDWWRWAPLAELGGVG